MTKKERAAAFDAAFAMCEDCQYFHTCDGAAGYMDCVDIAVRLEKAGFSWDEIPDLLVAYNEHGHI